MGHGGHCWFADIHIMVAKDAVATRAFETVGVPEERLALPDKLQVVGAPVRGHRQEDDVLGGVGFFIQPGESEMDVRAVRASIRCIDAAGQFLLTLPPPVVKQARASTARIGMPSNCRSRA